jgi:hypothetical protein
MYIILKTSLASAGLQEVYLLFYILVFALCSYIYINTLVSGLMYCQELILAFCCLPSPKIIL